MDHHLDPLPQLLVGLRTWVQCISEGQIEEHSREDEDSVESDPLEPLVLEGLPDGMRVYR